MIYKNPNRTPSPESREENERVAAEELYRASNPINGMEENEEEDFEEDEEEGRGSLGCLVVLLIILLVVGIAGFIGFRVISKDISGNRGGTDDIIYLEVQEGASAISVAESLDEAGVINNATVFRFYCQFQDVLYTFQYGTHTFTSQMSFDEIVTELQQPTIEQIPSVYVTIPEGTTVIKTAWLLEEAGLCTTEEFLDACWNDTFDVSFYTRLPSSTNVFCRMEGFLYPDTYEFPIGSTAHDCIQMMLENFEKNVWTPEVQAQISASGHSLVEIITMASIIEEESFGGEHYKVSSVFWNRINDTNDSSGTNGMLQSDTTYNYIRGVIEYYYDGNAPVPMVSAYDSYSVRGLIAGPISSPGWNCIDAALNPADTDYYFFVTDEEANYYWATTYSEHLDNCATADAVNARVRAAAGN